MGLARVNGAEGLLGEVPVIGKDDWHLSVAVDLTAFDRVTRMELVEVDDSYGLGVDDFDFEQLD